MTWPTAVDGQGWMRKTERRLALLERIRHGGGGAATTLAVQDTLTLDLTLSGTPTTGYTLKGDVLQAPVSLTVQDTASVNMTLAGTGTAADPFTIRADVIPSAASGTWKLASDMPSAHGAFTLLAAATEVGTPTSGAFTNTGGAIQVAAAGLYQVMVSVKWASNTSGSRRYVGITKNATDIDGGGNVQGGGQMVGVSVLTPSPAGDFSMECFSHRFAAAAGDTIRVFVFQDSGATVNALQGSPITYYGETLVSVYRA